jgi:autotransporter-associated beta strand protein
MLARPSLLETTIGFRLAPIFAAILAAVALGAPGAHAANISKAAGTGALNVGGSWVGGTAPGAGDIAVFDSNLTLTAQPQVIFGGNLIWGGIIVTNPVKGATSTTNGLMIGTSSAGNTSVANLTLGNSSLTNGGGIDMSSAVTPLYIGANITLAANQTWNVDEANSSITTPATGTGSAISPFALTEYESLVISGSSAGSNTTLMPFNLGGYTLTTTGLGGIVLNSGLDISNGTINIGSGAQNVTSNYNNTQAFVIQSGSTRQSITESSVTLNVTDATLRFAVNSGAITNNGTINLNNNAVLNLISANSAATNIFTDNGPINVLGSSIIADTNAVNSGGGQSQPISLNGNLTGSAPLQVQVITTGTGGIVLSGNDSAYTGAITLDAPSGNGTLTINSTAAGSSAATWTINAGNTIRLNNVSAQLGTLDGAGTLSGNSGASTANIGAGAFSGNVVNGGGTLAVNMTGSGLLTLSNATNTYTGGTTVNGGTLSFKSLGTGGITVNGGTLQWNASTADISSQVVTLNNSATFDTNGNNVTLANPIGNSGSGSLSKIGNGNLSLAGANTYTGGTIISAGTLTAINASGSATGTGAVSIANGATLAGNGTLSGLVTANAGANISPGNNTSTIGILTLGSLTLNPNAGGSNATLNFEISSNTSLDQIDVTTSNGLTINGGSFNIYAAGTTTPFTTSGNYNLIQFSGSILGAYSSNLNQLTVLNNTVPGVTYSFSAPSNFLVLTIANSVVANAWNLNGSSNWSNATAWTNSVVPAANSTVTLPGNLLTSPATITLDSNRSVAGLDFTSSIGYTIGAGGGTLSIGNATTPGNLTVSQGSHIISAPITLAALGVTANISAGGNLSIPGNIGDNGSGASLTKIGNGQLNLTGTNTYSGPTNVSAGTLSFGALNSLGTGTILNLNGGSLQWNGTNTADISTDTVTIGAGGATFDTNGNNVTLANPIGNSGAGNLTKIGNGQLNLLAANTYSGANIVNAGTLSFASLASLGTGTILNLNGGTLQWYGTNTADISSDTVTIGASGATFDTNGNNVTLAHSIGNSGTGNLTKIGNGNLTLSVAPAYTGSTIVNGGTLIFGATTTIGASSNLTVGTGATATIATGATLTASSILGTGTVNLGTGALALNNAANDAFAGSFTGSGAFSKTGAGNLTLSGISSGTGALTIANGNVEIDAGGILTAGGGSTSGNTGASLFINGGIFTSTGTFTVNSVVTGSNSGFYLQSGNATFSALTINNSSGNSGQLPNADIAGGNFTAATVTIPRTSGSSTGVVGSGFNVSGGNANITGSLIIDTTASASALVDGGNLTVGTIDINEAIRTGSLQVTSGNLTVTNGGIVFINTLSAGCATVTLSGGISNVAELSFASNSSVTSSSTATLNLNGGALYVGSGGMTKNGSSVVSNINLNSGILGASGNWSSSVPMVLNGATIETADVNGAPHNITISGALSGSNLLQSGGGTLSLSNVNTYTGTTTISGGTVAAAFLNSAGGGDSLGSSSSAPANLIINNGTLQYIGAGNTTDRSFTLTGASAALDASGTGAITYSNVTAINYATPGVPNTFTLTGTSTAANTLAANINDNGSGATSLVKNGAGSWIATGTNNLSGPTTINAGTLTINSLPNSSVTVNPGGALNPVSGVGTLTVPALTLAAPAGSANATLNFDFSSASSYDQIVTTANDGLTLNGGGFDLYEVGTTNPWATTGVYDLIQYSGTIQGSLAGDLNQLAIFNPAPTLNYNFTTDGTYLILDITATLPINSWALDGNGNWSNPSNWSFSTLPATTATANFLGSAITAPRTITLDGSQQVAGLYFNSSDAYTIAAGTGTLSLVNDPSPANITVALGAHTISAPVTLDGFGLAANITSANSLTLSGNINETAPANITTIGTGTLVLTGNNTYSGGTFLNSGILNFNSTANFGTGAITFNGGTLQWAAGTSTDISSIPLNFNGSSAIFDTNGNSVTLAGNIGTGSTGSVTKTGLGVLTLTGNNSYSGGTSLLGGELGFTTTSNFGTGALTFNGGGLQWGSGITTDISGITMTFAGPGLLDTNGNNVTLANPIGNNGPGALVKNGLGVLTLAANETYTGNTTINAGTLALATATAIPSSSTIVINSSGNLDVSGVNASLNAITGTGILNLGASNFSVGNLGVSSTFAGAIQGTNVTNKIGSGTFTLTGASPYSGALNISSGTLAIGPGATLDSVTSASVSETASAELLINGGNLVSSASTNVGAGSIGLLVTSGSATFNGGLTTDLGSDTNALIEATGGNLTASSIDLGRGGNTSSSEPSAAPTSQGLYINGGNVLVTGNLDMSTSGVANSMVSARMDSGSLTVDDAVDIALNNGNRWSIFDVNGGTFTDANTTTGVIIAGTGNTAGGSGNAIWTVRAGNSMVGRVQVGQNGTATGDAVLSVSGGNLFVGAGGIAQGTSSMADSVTLAGGNLGATANWSTSVPVNFNGGNLTAADAGNNPYTITLTGTIGGASNLNKTGAGTLVIANTGGYSGNTNISGGTLQIGNGGASGSLGDFGGSVVNDNANLIFNLASNYSVDVPIAGTGAVVQNGPGVTTFTLPNTYTGNTTVNTGTLVADNTLASANVIVNSGATLVGDGTLAGNVFLHSGGTLAPGDLDTVGLLTLGSLTLAANSTLDFEFNTNPANDQIIVSNSGGLVINGGNIYLYQEGTTTPFVTPGTYTDLIQYSGAIGGAGNSSLAVANPQLGLAYTIAAISGQIQITIADNFGNNTWTDTSGFGSWSTTANWNSVVPSTGQGPSGIGITVNFPNILTNQETIETDQNATFGVLNFESNPAFPGAVGYDLEDSGGVLTLNNNGTAAVINNLGGIQVINSPLTLTTNGVIANISAGTSLTLGGVISDTVPATLTINGTGNLTLGGANTYRGGTILNGATLDLTNASALGAGNFTINGGNLDNSTGSQLILTGFGQQFWNGNFTYLASSNANLDLGSSNITLGNSIVVTIDQNTLSVEGSIAGSGFGLTEVGPGGLNLNGVSTFNGGLTVNGGSVNFGIADAVAPANNVTIIDGGNFNLNSFDQSVAAVSVTNGTITGSGNLSATSFTLANATVISTLAGAATLSVTSGNSTLFGASNYTGATSILAGNLILSGGNNRLPATTTVALGSTGNTASLILGNNTAGAISQTLAGLTLAAGSGSVRGGNTTANSTLDLNIPGGDDIFTGVLGDGTNSTTGAGNHLALVKDGTGEFDLQGGNSTFLGGITLDAGTLGLTAAGTVAGVGPITFNGGTLLTGNATTAFPGTFASTLVIPSGITANITTVGADNQTFSGAVSGSGALDIAVGPVTSFSGNLAFAAFNGTINLSTNGSLRFQGAFDHALGNATINLGADGTLLSRDGSSQTIGAITGGPASVLSGSSSGGNTTYVIGALNVDDTFSGNITNGGAAGTITSITKSGAANLTLAGTGSYLGNTTISSGTLVLGSGTAVSPNSTVVIASGANFNVNGQIATIGGLNGTGPTNLNGGALITGTNNLSTTYNGVLSGIGSLTTDGAGNLTLTATSTLAGPVTVNSGGLVLSGNLTSSDVVVNSGAILVGSGTSGNIGGALTLEPSGHLSLAPANTTLLTVGSFTWNTDGTASLFYSLGSGSVSSTLNILGALTQGSSPTPGNPGQFIFDFHSTGFFGGVYTLMDFGSSSGFATTDFAYQNLAPGLQGQFDLQGNSLTFSVSAIPEPATTALTLGAFVLLVARRRRQQAAAKQG